MKTLRLFAILSAALVVISSAQAINLGTVPIGNPGNPADPAYFRGSVAYPFRMGTTEVTNAQYVEFLNAVAASDPYQLYSTSMESASQGGIVRNGNNGSFSYAVKIPAIDSYDRDYVYDNKPVVFVNWFSTIRFANWLHNGQGGPETTEYGAYTLLGGTPVPSNANTIARNPGARWWLPNLDEWYKAAYYDPELSIYYRFPMGDNSYPDNNMPSLDSGNSANFVLISGDYKYYTTDDPNFPMTDAGAYTLSGSPYSTFDQGGNVAEWTEFISLLTSRAKTGSSWFEEMANYLSQSDAYPATAKINRLGFRVASSAVPEPSSLLLAAMTSVGLLLSRCANVVLRVRAKCSPGEYGRKAETQRN